MFRITWTVNKEEKKKLLANDKGFGPNDYNGETSK
jgi:hypothetical protein